MSFHEIDDTLVEYFKQMLAEESEFCDNNNDAQSQKAVKSSDKDDFGIDTSSLDACLDDAGSSLQPDADKDTVNVSDTVSSDSQESSIEVLDTQSSFDNPLENDSSVCSSLAHFEALARISSDPLNAQIQDQNEKNDEKLRDTDISDDVSLNVETATAAENENSTKLAFAEPHPLEKLLEKVETKTENATQEEVRTDTQEAVQTVEQDVKSEQKEAQIIEDTKSEDNNKSQEEWHNIELPKEFQALFFLVKGIRFAVPLVNLGGIFQSEKITPLFGKPKWFMGIADIRGKKMNVVDTLKWVKSDAPDSENYEYKIALDNTLWSIGCDELEGNRILSNDSVTWRQHSGNRPWLAGIVKKEMCALLHVEELIKMCEKGVNLKDLDLQMSE